MLKIINDIRFIPKYSVYIGFWQYYKYFHVSCFYFYWHKKSIFEIENDKDKSIKKHWDKFNEK